MPGWVQEYTLQCKQGDQISFTASYQEDDGTPIDITGWTPELAISKSRGKAHLQRWTAAPQVEITDGENGVVTVTLTPDETRAWGRSEELVYELTVTPPSGETVTILEGPLMVRLEVGHDE